MSFTYHIIDKRQNLKHQQIVNFNQFQTQITIIVHQCRSSHQNFLIYDWQNIYPDSDSSPIKLHIRIPVQHFEPYQNYSKNQIFASDQPSDKRSKISIEVNEIFSKENFKILKQNCWQKKKLPSERFLSLLPTFSGIYAISVKFPILTKRSSP